MIESGHLVAEHVFGEIDEYWHIRYKRSRLELGTISRFGKDLVFRPAEDVPLLRVELIFIADILAKLDKE
jgi:hypothetical protein